MNTQKLFDEYLPSPVALTIEEASGEVDGQHIIGRVRGPFFVPGGISRNKRKYSKGLWEKTLTAPDVVEKLGQMRMFGTISHEQPLDDKALLEGKASHIVTKLAIGTDGMGIGEAVILGTPAGRILNTYLRAGAKMFVSSRAFGTFKGEEDGVPLVDEDTYKLQTFDFVGEPGFLQANPSLAESLKEDLNVIYPSGLSGGVTEPASRNPKGGGSIEEEEVDMTTEKLIESLQDQANKARTDLADASESLGKATAELEHAKGQMKTMTESLEAKDKEIAGLKKWAESATLLGAKEPGEVESTIEAVDAMLEQFKDMIKGKFESIPDALKFAMTIAEKMESTNADEIVEVMEQAADQLEAYKEIGTPEEIKETLENAESVMAQYETATAAEQAKKLAETLNVPEERILLMLQKGMSVEEVENVFKDISTTSQVRERYTRPGKAKGKSTSGKDSGKPKQTLEGAPENPEDDDLENPPEGGSPTFTKSPLDRMQEGLAGRLRPQGVQRMHG